MDEFVRNKLTEWGLSEWLEKFKDQQIDEESLYCLDIDDIDALITKAGPKAKFKTNLKLLKEECNTNQETAGIPDLPSTSNKGKRKPDLQGESSTWQPPPKQQRDYVAGPDSDTGILSYVKNTMREVNEKLHSSDKLSAFLKEKIYDLETDKRELVGVFGKTGAGKSSLINAIINKEGLLPFGSVSACTSVMIKVEASKDSMYEAHIEFITKEDWENEVQSLKQFTEDEDDDDNNADYRDPDGKLSALYGEEWKEKSTSSLLENRYFRGVPEFLNSQKKTFKSNTAKGLSEKYVEYTRSDSNEGEHKEGKRWYWPLVKCVTVRVPDNDFLQHVTLVDLPGNGDCNKSRDQMWTEFVGQCSVVWIVTEMNRAASEKEAWDILEGASSLIGNSGQCQQIHFICTKSDHKTSDVINKVKAAVRKEFNKRKTIKNHFSDDCFEVFTVSSTEFLEGKNSNPDANEIPKLQEFLKNLNNTHSETLNYVSGAYGILCLIQGVDSREGDDKKNDVCAILEGQLSIQLNQVKKAIEQATKTFEQCLSEGVEESPKSCKKKLKSVLHPNKKNSAFHGTLKAVVKNDGIYKSRKGKPINLNMTLASCLTESIDEEFRKIFPNEGKCGHFNGAIDAFSLGTNSLIQKYKEVELQLRFLRTEEEKIKAKLNKIIRREKKSIYCSLTDTIKNNMKECYREAAVFRGKGVLKNITDTIETHVYLKNEMFEEAKTAMLDQLNDLKEKILKILQKNMEESIELSLKTESYSPPVISEQVVLRVKKYHDQLKNGKEEKTSQQ